MNPSTIIKEKLVAPALEGGEVEKIEKATAIWKNAVEAETKEFENSRGLANIRSEKIRFWVPILAPMISAGALIAALLFQVVQFRKNTEITRDTAEDTAWREVLKAASDTKGAQSAFSFTLIKSFFDSPRYAGPAREISITILGHLPDVDSFKLLFSEIASRTTWQNANDLTRIDSNINKYFQAIPDDPQQDDEVTSNKEFTDMLEGRITPRMLKGSLNKELGIVASEILEILKTAKASERRDVVLSLDDCQFGTMDISNVDLSGTTINGTLFFRCIVDGANLTNIDRFEDSEWDGTPWWYCEKIDKPLLNYLEEHWPYTEGKAYAGKKTITTESYKKVVAELKERSKILASTEKK